MDAVLTTALDMACPRCAHSIPKAIVVSAAMSIIQRSRPVSSRTGPPKVPHLCPLCSETIHGTVAFRRHVPKCRRKRNDV